MAKFKNENKQFSSAPISLINDDTIPDRARFIYVYMNAKPEGWEFFHEPMAKALKIGVDTLKKYIDILIERGWLEKGDQQNEKGKFGAVEYTLKAFRKKTSNKNTDTEKYRNGKIPQQDNNSTILNSPINKDNSIILNNPVIDKEEKRLSNDNPKNKRFVKPTIEQIQAYIDEKKLHFEADRFFDYYESKGWMVGKNHMKDWKAACRTWESMRKSEKREEKEESAQVQEMSEVEAIVWKNNQEWMEKMVPRLKDRITYDDFCKMRAMAHFKADVYADILVHIEKSGYDGDIVDEFDRMCETEYYERIWSNG